VYHDTLIAHSIVFYSALRDQASSALFPAYHLDDLYMAYSQLSWLVVYYFDAIGDLSCELNKLLMRWVFVNVIVSILGAFELDHKAVSVWVLGEASATGVRRHSRSHTACPSGLLFFPPVNDLM
jgi:hypothetical protein